MAIQRSDSSTRTRAKVVRMTLLIAILAMSTTLGILHQVSGVKPVSVDALCPFGGIESLWSVISTGTLLAKIAWSSFILLGATLLPSGVQTYYIGGTLSVGANQLPGDYSGTFALTVNYL